MTCEKIRPYFGWLLEFTSDQLLQDPHIIKTRIAYLVSSVFLVLSIVFCVLMMQRTGKELQPYPILFGTSLFLTILPHMIRNCCWERPNISDP